MALRLPVTTSRWSLHLRAPALTARHATVVLLAVSALSLQRLHAQSHHASRPPADRAEEIQLARSAAPAAVAANARVWTWNGQRYVIADSGKTQVNCFVSRAWVPSTEPHCFDEEGSSTILPILMFRVERFAAGASAVQVDREVREGITAGKFRVPRRPAVTYMMSASQKLVSESGSAVGAWEPHLMIYFPSLTAEGVGLPGFVAGVGFVEKPGTPLSALVIPLKSFVDKTP